MYTLSLHSAISGPTNTTLFIEKKKCEKDSAVQHCLRVEGGGGEVRGLNGEARRAKREDSDEIGGQQCACVYNFVADYKLF